jgi:hypothetical protein
MRDMPSACGPQQRDLLHDPQLARGAHLLVHDEKRADRDTVASIKPYKLRRWLARSAWPSRITTANTTTSFFSASKNCVENGSPTRCLLAKEWKSHSRRQFDVRVAEVRDDANISFVNLLSHV